MSLDERETLEITMATCRDAGVAPVKAEYRVTPTAVGSVAASTSNAAKTEVKVEAAAAAASGDVESVAIPVDHGADGSEAPSVAEVPSRKRQRGMNKHRKPFKADTASEIKLCSSVKSGSECKFGANCRFSHDLAAYLSQRPADLGETCPIYSLRGECRFGITCRFGACHLGADGVSLRSLVHPPPEEEMNSFTWELSNRLRKRDYNFERADGISAPIVEDLVRQHEQHQADQASFRGLNQPEQPQQPQQPPAAEPAPEPPPAAEPSAAEPSAAEPSGEAADGSAAAGSAGPAAGYHERASIAADVPLFERKLIDFRGAQQSSNTLG